MRVALFFGGFVRYRVGQADTAALFALLHTGGFSPKSVERCKKTGEISFLLTWREAKRLDALLLARGIGVTGRTQHGLPCLLRALAARPGMIAGVLLAVLLLVASSLFVWELEISCDAELPHEEIIDELSGAGLYRGAFLPRLDAEGIETALRRADGRIAFVAVNVTGTVVRVQIRASEKEPAPVPLQPANLVARCDGVITLPLVYEGNCLVAPGDVVRAGQILASGLLDTQNHGYRVTRAAGEVLARTTYTYTVRIPLFDTERVQTGREKREITLLFFDRARKVFKNSGNLDSECDIIENTNWLCLPSGKRLPFGITTVTYLPYEHVAVKRTTGEALLLAQAELAARLAADSAGRTLLSRTEEVIEAPDALTLVCRVVCEEDIASVAEFSFAP